MALDRDPTIEGFNGINIKPISEVGEKMVPSYVRAWCLEHCEDYGGCDWLRSNCQYYNNPQWMKRGEQT